MNTLDKLRAGGVVGGGGAGFPTWKKLSASADTLLVNGAECEPLLQSDQYLMLHEAEALVHAAWELGQTVGAKRTVIALKDHYHAQREALAQAIERLQLPVELHDLPTVYPVGDEQSVVFECTGRAVPPRGLPGSVGCTVVSVSTTLNAGRALADVPVTRRLVTVAGEVANPGLYDVPIGTSIPEVLAAAGGITTDTPRILLGGPMMGALQTDPEHAVVTKTCGGVLVFDDRHLLVNRARLTIEQMRSRARSCCIQCRSCTDLCPRYLLGHPIYPHLTMRGFGSGAPAEPSAILCMECGVCELFACPMGLSPRRIQQLEKEELRKAKANPSFAMVETQRETRPWRQAPSGRIALRVDVARYAFDTPATVTTVAPHTVRIPLKQHIGAPATATVRVGDSVRAEQLIGQMAPDALGADVHASIDGQVTEVTDYVTISGEAGV